MNRLSHPIKRALAATLVLLAALATPIAAQNATQFPSIAMSVTPDRSTYCVGEPIVLKCRIVNWHTPLLTLTSVFGLHGEQTDLRILREGVESDRYRAHFEPSPVTPKDTVLAYGKTHEWEMVVCYEGQKNGPIAIDKPGLYHFRVTQDAEMLDAFRPPATRTPIAMTATTVEPIRVVEPSAGAAGALELLRSRPTAIRDIGRRYAALANGALLERVATEYPDSPYAPFCLEALARRGLVAGRTVATDTEQSIRYFRRLIARYPDYIFRDTARIMLAETYRDTYRTDAGAAIARELVAEDEDNLYRFRTYEIMVPLRGPLPNPFFQINSECWCLFPSTELTDAYVRLATEVGIQQTP